MTQTLYRKDQLSMTVSQWEYFNENRSKRGLNTSKCSNVNLKKTREVSKKHAGWFILYFYYQGIIYNTFSLIPGTKT